MVPVGGVPRRLSSSGGEAEVSGVAEPPELPHWSRPFSVNHISLVSGW